MPFNLAVKDTPLLSQQSSEWFQELRTQIIDEFELIENEYAEQHQLKAGTFEKTPWSRPGGGGGEMAIMKGQVFEKVGVNFSEVYGEFSDEFKKKIPGADKDPTFWACGVSLVAHMASPHVPAVHMNTRFIQTQKQWFGGGADLTPYYPNQEDTEEFHATFKKACDNTDPSYYPHYKQWCDEYFFLPHRNEPRGIGGIFFDNLNSGNLNDDFEFVKNVGLAFKEIYPKIVRRRMHQEWSEEERQYQLMRRGRYVEFNLLYDRGTLFGLQTNGNVEAILMSMPPKVEWP